MASENKRSFPSPFQFGCFILFCFVSFSLPNCFLELPGQGRREVMGAEILVLIFMVEKRSQSFTVKSDVNQGFFIDAHYQVKKIPFYS